MPRFSSLLVKELEAWFKVAYSNKGLWSEEQEEWVILPTQYKKLWEEEDA